MPTVILLDNSLSMNKTLDKNGQTQKDIAFQIIKYFLNEISRKEMFEYVSLVKFFIFID